MTAAWEQELEKIAHGSGSMPVFMEQINKWISQLCNQLKENSSILTQEGGLLEAAFKATEPPSKPCFKCQGKLKRIKGKNGHFWACQNDACKQTFNDERGKLVEKIAEEDSPDCPECMSPMKLRKGKAPGKSRASKFWGCSDYPKCKGKLEFKRKKAEDPLLA